MRILLVEDDEVIAERLKFGLTKAGMIVDYASDGIDAVEKGLFNRYSVIVLDVMLPGKDGWTVCSELRRSRIGTPILMLTARDQTEDKVKGLDMGADDYLAKPFEFTELVARIRALARRDKTQKTSTIFVADLEIDTINRSVKRAGESLHLTPREYTLLEALARNVGRTLTREIIVEEVWGDDESFSNTVNFHITSLRKKIDVGRKSSLIKTMHGFGYVMRSDEEDAG